MQYTPIESFDSLRRQLLSPLESALLDEKSQSRTALLDCYSNLISEWGVKLRIAPSPSEESTPLSEVIKHAELLASSIQEFTPALNDNESFPKPMLLSVCEFYKSLTDLFSHASQNARIRIKVPLATTVYTIAFTPSVANISILGSLLKDYKSSFETSLSSKVIQHPPDPESLYDQGLVARFNGYVMDICNLLWRNRGLNKDDPNAMSCLLPESSIAGLTHYISNVNDAARHYDRESAINLSLSMIFSLSHHAAFCNLSAACFADLEDEQLAGDRPKLRKPVTQKALQALEKDGGLKTTWQEYRVHMLDWLDAVGSRGTGDLMRSTMKALRKE